MGIAGTLQSINSTAAINGLNAANGLTGINPSQNAAGERSLNGCPSSRGGSTSPVMPATGGGAGGSVVPPQVQPVNPTPLPVVLLRREIITHVGGKHSCINRAGSGDFSNGGAGRDFADGGRLWWVSAFTAFWPSGAGITCGCKSGNKYSECAYSKFSVSISSLRVILAEPIGGMFGWDSGCSNGDGSFKFSQFYQGRKNRLAFRVCQKESCSSFE